jgi:maltose/maltodextrin transport system permease protein
MQSVSGAKMPNNGMKLNYKHYLKWFVLGLIGLVNGYAATLMYMNGEFPFAMLTVIVTSLGLYFFGSKKTYAHRYIFPGIAGMIIFVLFPLFYTVNLAFTNYSGKNQLTFERAQGVFLDRTYKSGDSYPFTLHEADNGYQLSLKVDGEELVTPVIALDNDSVINLDLTPGSAQGEALKIKEIIAKKNELGQIELMLPNQEEVRMSGLRKFGAVGPLYTKLDEEGELLKNNRTGAIVKANFETGFYQEYDESTQQFVSDEGLAPGFIVANGIANFERIYQDEGIQEPFMEIFIWTIFFAVATVVLTLVIGLVLACIVQWEALRGRAVYRVLLILPYAVPSFISILVFKGLFNNSFGEINMILDAIFGIKPTWFTDPTLARLMVIIVNIWLGFPYMMILAMGLLKAIPEDLYEASAIDGANFIQNFKNITLPLIMKPMAPLLIASFAFNFNNFVMIYLLTEGGPNMIGVSEPAGYTDLLVSYTYRIAFEGSGTQDFGLASAIATLIFLLVGGLALLNLRFTKLTQD